MFTCAAISGQLQDMGMPHTLVPYLVLCLDLGFSFFGQVLSGAMRELVALDPFSFDLDLVLRSVPIAP